jgi:hypothetical protein
VDYQGLTVAVASPSVSSAPAANRPASTVAAGCAPEPSRPAHAPGAADGTPGRTGGYRGTESCDPEQSSTVCVILGKAVGDRGFPTRHGTEPSLACGWHLVDSSPLERVCASGSLTVGKEAITGARHGEELSTLLGPKKGT